jgi:hypothetical protein
VIDLAVVGVTDLSVTLRFTEVNSGLGLPASYEIRYAVGTMSWGSATSVQQGTCATPVVGTAIGAVRTCTVSGLSPSTSYQFQGVAFRGTLNVDAIFGSLSNLVSGTTAVSTAPVASVTVSPPTAGVAVGQTVPLMATPKDAAGNSLTGRVITWVSSNSGIASVNTTGLVTGVVVGSATITATSEGQSGTAAITVTALPPPPAPGVVFESKWTTALGNARTAVTDGGAWDQFSDFGQGRILAVVSGGPAGYANALRVTQEGETGGAAYLQRNNFLTAGTDFYVRYYMRNDDVNSGSYDHIVSAWFAPVPPVSLWYMMKGAAGGGWGVGMASNGNGGDSDHYPVYGWQLRGPNNTSILPNGRWYRFEYWVHFVTATTMQFHVRIYDDANTLLYTDADMRQLDYGSAVWNGSNTWTLASFYAAGHTMTIDPLKIVDFGMGNNAQAGTVNTGQYWYYAGVQIRTDHWPGP